MKVSELPYHRVTIEEVTAVMEDVLARIKNAASADEILKAREDYLKILLKSDYPYYPCFRSYQSYLVTCSEQWQLYSLK